MLRTYTFQGVFAFETAQGAQAKLVQEHRFSDDEREALIRAKRERDDAALARVLESSGVHGDDLESRQPVPLAQLAQLSLALRPIADRTLLYATNMEMTKRAIGASVTPDLIIINTINAIEELDKVANTLSKRMREWYALYDPELEHRHKDHRDFIDAMIAQGAQGPAHGAQRASGTMGGSVTAEDIAVMRAQAASIKALYAQRDALVAYLEESMQTMTPNIKRVAGATIGGKLLSMAGSLERLSRLPSSTVQLLGAETALFRHLRNPRARPPKHGIIFNHIVLQRASRELRGKAARVLADKISIAAKIDYFKGEYIGDALAAEIEKKLAADEESLKHGKKRRRDERQGREAQESEQQRGVTRA